MIDQELLFQLCFVLTALICLNCLRFLVCDTFFAAHPLLLVVPPGSTLIHPVYCSALAVFIYYF